eukprot:TRINITY_DN3706_c0_g1_i1.p1 TRINITY_DN3706_c0_g1~~TRINITY_DN3706_c0_g1_i1.p1  ORF type:complete len:278 (-),score=58.63 TRINITY_DN3706_c0_g1_i1:33-866(-)
MCIRDRAWLSGHFAGTGRAWVAHYGAQGPRGPAQLPFWPTDAVNQRHSVPALPGPPLELIVLSTAPKVLLVPSLLSPEECSLIMQLATPKLAHSTVGAGSVAHKDTTRASKTAWLKPSAHELLRTTIYPRLARLFPCLKSSDCAEDMQVVRYHLKGDEYAHHYDFFETGEARNRFATLLIYLNDPDPGAPSTDGGTGFPKAFGGQGLQARPKAGSAVLFYNMLPDGNGDRLSEHAGLPVQQSEKWIANLWIWDPNHSEGPPNSVEAAAVHASADAEL